LPSPDVSWRINAERLVVLAWVRAILLQLAHPLIAAGVAEHSTFRASTPAALSRLHQTVGAMLAISFGDAQAREAALEGIRAIHRRVHGTLGTACGPFPAGTPYSAEDPALLLWVHATLVDSVVLVYDALVAPLTDGNRDIYCADAAEVAVALGADPETVPRSWDALRAYVETEIASGSIAPCRQARELAAALLAPSAAMVMTPVNGVLRLAGAGLLPDELRRAYGFEWSARRERAFRALMTTLRMTRRVAPRRVAWWPAARSGRSGPPRPV
jgi:uncharacterized protein (DUF2236 family)